MSIALLKRLIVLFCVCIAAWFVFYTPLTPLVSIKPADFKAKFEKAKPDKRASGSLLPENKKQTEANLTFKEFVANLTEGRLIAVEGKKWETFLKDIISTYNGIHSQNEWNKRYSSEYKGAGLFFSIIESPINLIKDKLTEDNQTIYLTLLSNGKAEYLELTYHEYSNDKFHIGSGLSDYPDPPSWLFYPYRKLSIWIALSGFSLYFLLFKKKPKKDSIHFKRWFIIGNDTAFIILLIALPFIAPLAIMGGSVQVFFTEGIFLLPFFWLITLIGVFGFIFIMPRFERFELEFLEDGFRAVTTKGERRYSFKDMRYFQPITFKRPRWLIFLSWLALLSGRSGGFSAFFLGTQEHAGIGIKIKNSSVFYINTSNPMGMDVLNQKTDDILKILQNAGIEEKTEKLIIRTMGLEPVGVEDGKHESMYV